MKRALWLLLGAAFVVLLGWTHARAADDYDDFALTIDTAPNASCLGSDGCANVEARSLTIKNTGSNTIFCRPDVDSTVGLTWDTTGAAGIAAGETVEMDVTARGHIFHKVWCKTTSSTSTAVVRRIK